MRCNFDTGRPRGDLVEFGNAAIRAGGGFASAPGLLRRAAQTAGNSGIEIEPLRLDFLAAADAGAVFAALHALQGLIDADKFTLTAPLGGKGHLLALQRVHPRQPADAGLVGTTVSRAEAACSSSASISARRRINRARIASISISISAPLSALRQWAGSERQRASSPTAPLLHGSGPAAGILDVAE